MDKTDRLLDPVSRDFCSLDYECAYIDGRSVRMFYKYIESASFKFNSEVIKRGWRRFGCYYFHPVCKDCNECKSLRIDVNNFNYSKSQKRAKKRNSKTSIVVQEPTISSTHIDLYNKFHNYKNIKDGWKQKDISYAEYLENFVDGAGNFGKEVLYIRDQKVIGVDLIDILEDGISSIYFFYDPSYSNLSLGVFSLLYQVEIAKKLNLEWVYLGYWVDGCKAFSYKTNFKPQQILDGFPAIDKEPIWIDTEL